MKTIPLQGLDDKMKSLAMAGMQADENVFGSEVQLEETVRGGLDGSPFPLYRVRERK